MLNQFTQIQKEENPNLPAPLPKQDSKTVQKFEELIKNNLEHYHRLSEEDKIRFNTYLIDELIKINIKDKSTENMLRFFTLRNTLINFSEQQNLNLSKSDKLKIFSEIKDLISKDDPSIITIKKGPCLNDFFFVIEKTNLSADFFNYLQGTQDKESFSQGCFSYLRQTINQFKEERANSFLLFYAEAVDSNIIKRDTIKKDLANLLSQLKFAQPLDVEIFALNYALDPKQSKEKISSLFSKSIKEHITIIDQLRSTTKSGKEVSDDLINIYNFNNKELEYILACCKISKLDLSEKILAIPKESLNKAIIFNFICEHYAQVLPEQGLPKNITLYIKDLILSDDSKHRIPLASKSWFHNFEKSYYDLCNTKIISTEENLKFISKLTSQAYEAHLPLSESSSRVQTLKSIIAANFLGQDSIKDIEIARSLMKGVSELIKQDIKKFPEYLSVFETLYDFMENNRRHVVYDLAEAFCGDMFDLAKSKNIDPQARHRFFNIFFLHVSDASIHELSIDNERCFVSLVEMSLDKSENIDNRTLFANALSQGQFDIKLIRKHAFETMKKTLNSIKEEKNPAITSLLVETIILSTIPQTHEIQEIEKIKDFDKNILSFALELTESKVDSDIVAGYHLLQKFPWARYSEQHRKEVEKILATAFELAEKSPTISVKEENLEIVKAIAVKLDWRKSEDKFYQLYEKIIHLLNDKQNSDREARITIEIIQDMTSSLSAFSAPKDALKLYNSIDKFCESKELSTDNKTLVISCLSQFLVSCKEPILKNNVAKYLDKYIALFKIDGDIRFYRECAKIISIIALRYPSEITEAKKELIKALLSKE